MPFLSVRQDDEHGSTVLKMVQGSFENYFLKPLSFVNKKAREEWKCLESAELKGRPANSLNWKQFNHIHETVGTRTRQQGKQL